MILPVEGNINKFISFGCSRTGASHVSQNTIMPCQDAYHILEGTFKGETYLVAAVADGHGSKKHDLSHFGSSLAVKTACDVILDIFFRQHSNEKSIFIRNFKTDFPHFVTKKWNDTVWNHYKNLKGNDIFTEEECRKTVYSRYGTTLIVIMIVYEVVFIAQLGDGDAILIKQDDQIETPFEIDDELVGGETYSLSSSAAPTLWQIMICDLSDVKFIHLSTDGLKNSYPTDETFHNFIRCLYREINIHGMQKVIKILPQTIDKFSFKGSGDDITLVGVLLDKDDNLANEKECTKCCREIISKNNSHRNKCKDEIAEGMNDS